MVSMPALVVSSIGGNPRLAAGAAEFVAHSFTELGSDFQPDGLDSDLLDIKRQYIDRGGQFFVGTENGTVVATSAVKRSDATTAEIKRVRVASDRRHQGYGGRVLQAALTWAAGHGYYRAVLDTQASNAPALALFGKFGFQETGRTGSSVLMSRDLGPNA
jgi:GNAT superfamily N-acetyltransferase